MWSRRSADFQLSTTHIDVEVEFDDVDRAIIQSCISALCIAAVFNLLNIGLLSSFITEFPSLINSISKPTECAEMLTYVCIGKIVI